jgi:hypothetical protein
VILIRFLILEKEGAMKFEIKWKRAYERIGEADGFRRKSIIGQKLLRHRRN